MREEKRDGGRGSLRVFGRVALCLALLILTVFALVSCEFRFYLEDGSPYIDPTPATPDGGKPDENTPDGETPSGDPSCEHEYLAVPAKEATCTEDGYTAYEECTKCHAKKGYAVIPATGHDYLTVEGKDPTDTEDGYSSYEICNNCGDIQGKIVIPAGHYVHTISEHAAEEPNPLFDTCSCGFSVVPDLRTRPLICDLSDDDFKEFEILYNMYRNREASCSFTQRLSSDLANYFNVLIVYQCPELFLSYYEGSLAATITTAGASWNPACMSDEEYADACEVISSLLTTWTNETREMTALDKERYVVNWLCENIEYSAIGVNTGSAYGALVDRICRCMGYAQVFNWAMNLMGVPCMAVLGDADGTAHSWNLVQVDGAWYQVDATFDAGQAWGVPYSVGYYINLTDSEIGMGTHRTYHEIYGKVGVTLPTCDTTDQNNFRQLGRYLTSTDDYAEKLSAILQRAVSAQEPIVFIRAESREVFEGFLSFLGSSNATEVSIENGIEKYYYSGGYVDAQNYYIIYLNLPIAPANPATVEEVTEPVADTAYHLAVDLTSPSRTMFFAGKECSGGLAVTSDFTRAFDLYMTEVTGGVRFRFTDHGVVRYIDVTVIDGNPYLCLSETPSAVFTYSSVLGAYTVTVNATVYRIGMRDGGYQMELLPVTQIGCVNARLVTIPGEVIDSVCPSTPVGEHAVGKLTVDRTARGETLYLVAADQTRDFLPLTTESGDAVTVYREEGTNGGYQFYFIVGDNKVYIHAYGHYRGFVRLRFSTAPGLDFVYNDTYGVYTVTYAGTDYFVGCTGSYNTLGLYELSELSGSNASSYYPAVFMSD